jgi:hypothetical protein
MKKFIVFIFQVLFAIFLLLVLLDLIYTGVYIQSSNRGKIDYVYNSKSRDYDVVILGSSRANNHFVTPMFEYKGLKAFNYGMSGGNLFEASLLLKLMVERKYTIKNVLLEADLNLSNEQMADGIASRFLPYIHNSKIIAKHFSSQTKFNELFYIPFYRYVVFEPQIGFREMFFNGIHKNTIHLDNLGYHPLGKNSNANMKTDLTNLKPLRNKYYEEIKQICKANKINLISVMTPMCANTKGLYYFDKAHKIYPEIHNYENAVEGDEYFYSCGHMNDNGSRKFTAIIIKDFFNK